MRPVNREILRIALPSILANITVPLVGMVDTAVVGHLQGTSGAMTGAAALIGGIAIGSMLFDLLYWNFGFLRVSTGGLTAQAFGRWHRDGAVPPSGECADTLVRSLTIALLSAVLLIALQIPVVDLAFRIVDCSPQVRELASQYFFIRIWAAPATLSLMTFKGWFIGMQDSVSAMVTDLVVNTVNIVGSIFLTFGIGGWDGLGYVGVAWGTVLAQYCGLLCAIILLAAKYRTAILPALRLRGVLKGGETRRFFSMNRDVFIRSLCFIAIYIGYTVISARYGDMLLASCSIMMKLLMIFSYFIDGFAYAGEAMMGKYIGAGDKPKARESLRWNFIWCGALAVAFMFIYGLCGVPMLRMMTSDVAVVQAARHYIPWLLLMPFAGCAAFAWDGIYIGATASSWMRNAMLLAVAAFFGVWTCGNLIAGEAAGEVKVHVLMAAYFAHLLARSLFLTFSCRKAIKIY